MQTAIIEVILDCQPLLSDRQVAMNWKICRGDLPHLSSVRNPSVEFVPKHLNMTCIVHCREEEIDQSGNSAAKRRIIHSMKSL